MLNIIHKNHTHRTAVAQAIVRVSNPETIKAVIENKIPKGNVFEMAKTAGLFAVKKTHEMIPDCHPLPIEFCTVRYDLTELSIKIELEVQTIYKTGVEVEAMHGVSVVALTIYDMLKPIDSRISIENISLIHKTGGKSGCSDNPMPSIKSAVIVCSDSISRGEKQDKSGKIIAEKLMQNGVIVGDYTIIPDEKELIQQKVNSYILAGYRMVVCTGGTGLSPRDVTPEALSELIEKRIPGIEEAIRSYGQQRTPYAMLSRSIVGLVGNCLIIGLPGSTRGASESMDAIFPAILHLYRIMQGGRHEP